MRLRLIAALAALSLSSSMAFASSGTASGVSAGAKAAGGVIAAGGGVGAAAAVSNMFRSSTKREVLAASPTRAPEISTSGLTAGLILLVGGVLVARGRRRAILGIE